MLGLVTASNQMMQIPLSGIRGRGQYAQVDDEDYDWLCAFSWCWAHGYAQTTIANDKRKYMHQLLMPAQPGLVTDHINRNKLDNRRANLRHVTCSENMRNTPARNPVGLKGVYLRKRGPRCKTWLRPWAATAVWRRKQYHLGCFATKEEAAAAYVNFVDKTRHASV